jgi:tetratricopeptide (TPR) repeat protein
LLFDEDLMSSINHVKTSEMGVNRNAIRLGILLVLLTAYIAYSGALRFDFAYDDFLIIVHNPRIQSAHYLWSYFTQNVWAQVRGGPGNLYRPLFMTWLLVNYEMFGLAAKWWHLAAILPHLLATLLVYVLARKLLPNSAIPALVAAVIFGLHPIHVEGVAWIAGATEPFSSCFFLGAFICFIEYRHGRSKPFVWFGASLFLYAAALFAKETTIVLPAVIACYDLCFSRRVPPTSHTTWIRRVATTGITLVPYAVVLGLYLGVRITVLHGFAHPLTDSTLRLPAWLLPWALNFYISQMLLPLGLGPFYDTGLNSGPSLSGLVLPLLVLVFLVLGIWWWTQKKKSYLPLFLASWFFLTLAPALGVFLLMSRDEAVHDRYLYLPSVAFAVFIGYVWQQIFLAAKERRRILQQSLATVGLAVLLALATYHQARYWQNDLVLFTRASAVAPNNSLAKLNLGAELLRRHQFKDSLAIFQAVIDQNPKSGIAFSLAAKTSYFLGDYVAANKYYLQALTLEPAEPEELYYFALSQIRLGRYQEALDVLQKGLSLWPDSPQYHYAMGLAMVAAGDWQGAKEQYKTELRLHPESTIARSGLADVEAQLKLAENGALRRNEQ